MTLKEQLLDAMKQAMKEKDVIQKNTIQLTRAAVLQVEKDKQITLDDEGIIDIISKEVKKRKDSLVEFEKSDRKDLVESLQQEIEILMKYLPEQLSDEELEQIVHDFIKAEGLESVKEIGKVMKGVSLLVKGKADGKRLNSCAMKFLK